MNEHLGIFSSTKRSTLPASCPTFRPVHYLCSLGRAFQSVKLQYISINIYLPLVGEVRYLGVAVWRLSLATFVSLRNATCVVITWILRFFVEDAQTMLGYLLSQNKIEATRARNVTRQFMQTRANHGQSTDQILIESQYRQFRSHTNLSSQIRKQQL